MAVACRKDWPLGSEAMISTFLLPAASGNRNCVLHLHPEPRGWHEGSHKQRVKIPEMTCLHGSQCGGRKHPGSLQGSHKI